MSLKLVTAETAPLDERVEKVLEAVDSLREAIRSGQIKAFAAVGIAADHETFQWRGCTSKTTHLEMHGAIASLLHSGFHED